MIKAIKLYFIDRRIKKINKQLIELHKQLKWIKEHMHDLEFTETFKYVKAIKTKLKLCNMELDSYKEDKRLLENKQYEQ